MTGSFLRKKPADLESFLLQQARSDRAPRGALQRTMVSVTSASLGVGLATSTHLAWGASAAGKVTPWLIAKCVAIGMTATLAAFVGAEQLGGEFEAGATTSQAPTALQPSVGLDRAAKPASAPASGPAALATAPRAPSPQTQAAPSRTAAAPFEVDARPSRLPSLPSSTAFDSSPAAGSPAALAREVARLRRARASLVLRQPEAAKTELDRYALEFPAGALRAEAAALRVEALALLGDALATRRLAEDFLTRFPGSPLVDRVRVVSGIAGNGGSKP